MSALTTLGNGSGFIYIVANDGTSIKQNLKNNLLNVKKLLIDASVGADLSGTPTLDSNRYWLDAAGVSGVLSGSEITAFIVNRGLNSPLPVTTYTIATGVATPIRKSLITFVNIEGEGSASDTLDTITTTDYNTGDIIIFEGATAAHIITFSNNTGNILLANAANFLTGDKTHRIVLQYNAGDTKWYEITRSPNPALSVATLRAAGIPQPISGVAETTLTNGGGTINLEPGVDKGVQVYLGSPTLAASWTIQIQAAPTTPYLDGDTMIVEYRTTATTGVNTVTIFGIALTTTQALQGRVRVIGTYKLSDTTWYYDIFYDVHGVDVTNKAYVDATFELALGNPAGNGYILSSTTGGVRSWIPNPGGSNLWQVGAGSGSIQTLGNGASASGGNSIAAGVNADATGANAISIGPNSQSNGVQGVALGSTAIANNQSSIALGDTATANGSASNAIGNFATSSLDETTNISGAIIIKKNSLVQTGDYLLEGAGVSVSIASEEVDLKSTADYTITLPSGALFYPDEVDLILTTIGGTVTAQPFIRAGKTGTLAFYLAIVQTTALTATLGNRERQKTLLTNAGSGSITAGVTTAATGSSTIKGRFVWRGLLVESE